MAQVNLFVAYILLVSPYLFHHIFPPTLSLNYLMTLSVFI